MKLIIIAIILTTCLTACGSSPSEIQSQEPSGQGNQTGQSLPPAGNGQGVLPIPNGQITQNVPTSASTISCSGLVINYGSYVIVKPGPVVGAVVFGSQSASGGKAPYTWTVVGGILPPGYSLNTSGVWSGAVLTAGTYNATIQVRDAISCTATATYVWPISQAVQPSPSYTNSFLTSLYQGLYARRPDADGYAYWLPYVQYHALPCANIAVTFLQTPEFKNGQANLGNQSFLGRLYGGLLNRLQNSGDGTYWLDALNGGMSRASVAQSFLLSPEFNNVCIQNGFSGAGTVPTVSGF